MNCYSISQVKNWQQCPYKWYLSRLYEPLELKDTMTVGKVTHDCIEHLYAYYPEERTFRIMEAKLNSIWSEYQEYSEKNWEYIHNKVFDYCMSHWNEYQHDPEIIATSIELPYYYYWNDNFCSIVTKPDMIVFYHKEQWLYSIKTGKPNRENIMIDDPQEVFYTDILHKLDIPIVGCIYELIFENGEIGREELEFNQHEIIEMTTDIYDCIRSIEDERCELDEYVCKRFHGWHCGMCDYKLICRAERLGLNRKQVIKDNFKEKNERN